jgi:menaquinone-specific isochorismate synthase
VTLTVTLDADPAKLASRLIARTTLLEAPVDLLAVGGAPGAVLWLHGRTGFAGRGRALTIPLPGGLRDQAAVARVADILAAIPTDRRPDNKTNQTNQTGPRAIGALPFDREAAATLVVPAVTVETDDDGRQWLTTLHVQGQTEPESTATLSTLPDIDPPDNFSLSSPRSHADWCAMVADTVDTIRSGRFAKVVLAREVVVEANRQFVPADILRRLQALYPSCMVFAVDGFLGASPELLISRRGRQVTSHPLAGTVARSGDADTDRRLIEAMLSSVKQRHEHRLVIDAVAATLGPLCDRLDVPDVPSVVSLRNVSHLGTLLQGELSGPVPPTALQLVAKLHPTPAVAGTPTADAIAYLQQVEGFDRGRYTGAVGWMDRRGNGEWAVGIRSAEVQANTARLFAGNGVVADSDPQSELAETQLKLQALLAAVVRP